MMPHRTLCDGGESIMTQIQAAVCTEFGAPLRLETLTLRDPIADEVEVTVEAVAICHSDISYADGAWGGRAPVVYGHEASGRITKLGANVSGFELGQRVVATLIKACGACGPCLTGKPTICERQDPRPTVLTRADGTAVDQGMHCGAFAEKIVVSTSQIVAMPESMPPESVCLLACGVITGIGAMVNAAQLRAGEDVVVIGAGGVGLNAIQGARIAGARRIVAVDLNAEKLETAKDFGATHTVLGSEKSPWKQAIRAMGRPADVVAVTVGAIPAYEDAMRYMGYGGRMVMVGMPHSGDTARYEPVIPAFLGQKMIGSKMGDVVIQRDIPWMADLYEQGRLKLDELVSGRWRLEQINEAIADTRAGGARRNVIMF
jgi:S-(hydroxymethyl)mycothiol dehydrogenase